MLYKILSWNRHVHLLVHHNFLQTIKIIKYIPKALQFRDRMCESTVYLNESGELSEVMQEVVKIEQKQNKIVCTGLLGERKEVENAMIVEANLMEHRIVLGRVN